LIFRWSDVIWRFWEGALYCNKLHGIYSVVEWSIIFTI
jgi:hypothetical protein